MPLAGARLYLAKGRAIGVTGRLVYREWEAENGSRRSKHQVIGRVRFGARPEGEADEQPSEAAPPAVAVGGDDEGIVF